MKKLLIIVLMAVLVVGVFYILPFGGRGHSQEKDIHENFHSIEIETKNAEIEILPTNGDSAKVLLTGNRGKDYKLNANIDGNTLEIEVSKKWLKWFPIDFSISTPKLKVYLPEEEYNKIEVETSNGAIDASHLVAKEIYLESDNGRIELEDAKATTIDVETNNGKVTLTNVEGTIKGESNNGSIFLETDSIDRPIQLDTNNGKIVVKTDKKPTNVTLELEVDNGEISVFGDKHYDGVVGDGENLIKLTANNGHISIDDK